MSASYERFVSRVRQPTRLRDVPAKPPAGSSTGPSSSSASSSASSSPFPVSFYRSVCQRCQRRRRRVVLGPSGRSRKTTTKPAARKKSCVSRALKWPLVHLCLPLFFLLAPIQIRPQVDCHQLIRSEQPLEAGARWELELQKSGELRLANFADSPARLMNLARYLRPAQFVWRLSPADPDPE